MCNSKLYCAIPIEYGARSKFEHIIRLKVYKAKNRIVAII